MFTNGYMETTNNICKKLEIDGEKKVHELFETDNVNENTLMQIINDGNDEFKNATGRNMTYSEMRSMFG